MESEAGEDRLARDRLYTLCVPVYYTRVHDLCVKAFYSLRLNYRMCNICTADLPAQSASTTVAFCSKHLQLRLFCTAGPECWIGIYIYA